MAETHSPSMMPLVPWSRRKMLVGWMSPCTMPRLDNSRRAEASGWITARVICSSVICSRVSFRLFISRRPPGFSRMKTIRFIPSAGQSTMPHSIMRISATCSIPRMPDSRSMRGGTPTVPTRAKTSTLRSRSARTAKAAPPGPSSDGSGVPGRIS